MTSSTRPSSLTRVAMPAKYDNAAAWLHALGDVPLSRVVMDPWPGTATEDDLVRFADHEDRLVELIDGTLVEKASGFIESVIATQLAAGLANFVYPRKLGIVAGVGAAIRTRPGRVRSSAVIYVEGDRLPRGEVPRDTIVSIAPSLVAEVVRRDNTKAEIVQKLGEYFQSGTRLAWVLDPRAQTVLIYREASELAEVLLEADAVDGEDVLPGFVMQVRELFDEVRDLSRKLATGN